MSFICEPHSEMWAVDTGCPYCRERKLEAEINKLREKADYSYEDTTRLAELRALAQAVVDGTKSNDYGVTLGIAIDALAVGLEVKGD